MTILKEDKIINFRKRLYQKNVPNLFKSGAQDLNPIEKCKTDALGKIIVSTSNIIAFFFKNIQKDEPKSADQYFSNLYLLFDILTKEAQNFSFFSDPRVPEKDIQEANNKITIEYLTKNLIIYYFDNIKLYNGLVNNDLLDKDLKTIIKKSNEGREYQILVDKTLENLIQTLKLSKPWKQSFLDIQEADLVCKLVGANLPQIEKTVLSRIVLESRSEIKKDTHFLTKILTAKTQLTKEDKHQKNHLNIMDKLDSATSAVLKKIDDSLGHAHGFMMVISASSRSFLGPLDEELKKNIAGLFFEYNEKDSINNPAGYPLNYSTSRYKMAMLFGYPELTRFAGSLQQDEKYRDCFLCLFKLYFDELIKQMDTFLSASDPKDIKGIEICLSETLKLVEKLDLEKLFLVPEKKGIQKKYLSLLKAMPLEQIDSIIDIKENLCRATQDDSKMLLENIRKILVDSCYEFLLGIEADSLSADELHRTIQKLITGYSLQYKPQRFFYQKFFEKYVGGTDGSISNFMVELFNNRKPVALEILHIFSDPNYVADLLSKEQIAFSDKMFKNFCEK